MRYLIPIEQIETKILLIRGQKVMLDKDLAILYGVKARRLREQVKRNITRFPNDFMFQLTDLEVDYMVSQNATPSRKLLGGSLPYVFTEQGVAMLSSVLNSPRAIQVNIAIMRAFVKLRQIIAGDKELSRKLDLLEKRVLKHDSDIRELVRSIRKLSMNKGFGWSSN